MLRTASRLLWVALTFALAAAAGAQPAAVSVLAENPLAFDRPDETLSVAWSALPGFAAGRVRVVEAATGAEAPSQVVDADGDGRPDELVFQADFRAREQRRFRIEAQAPAQPYPARTFAAHKAERDDVAWENDRIAFRTYGKGLWKLEDLKSSGVDIWLKRTPKLVIDAWYARRKPDNYHTDTGEGADFYKVGPTLGSGGTAVWHEGKLHRALNFAGYRILAAGPVRTVVELTYDPYEVGGREITEVRRITIDAGRQLYRQETTFRGGAPGMQAALGVVKREGLVGSMRSGLPWAWLSAWGPVDRAGGGHGALGSGFLVPRERLVEMRETDDHYLVIATAAPGEPLVSYAGAAWTAAGAVPNVEAWWDYLNRTAEALGAPIKVTLGRP